MPSQIFDPYQVLGLRYGATRCEARLSAHRKLLVLHPDKSKSAADNAEARRVIEAKKIFETEEYLNCFRRCNYSRRSLNEAWRRYQRVRERFDNGSTSFSNKQFKYSNSSYQKNETNQKSKFNQSTRKSPRNHSDFQSKRMREDQQRRLFKSKNEESERRWKKKNEEQERGTKVHRIFLPKDLVDDDILHEPETTFFYDSLSEDDEDHVFTTTKRKKNVISDDEPEIVDLSQDNITINLVTENENCLGHSIKTQNDVVASPTNVFEQTHDLENQNSGSDGKKDFNNANENQTSVTSKRDVFVLPSWAANEQNKETTAQGEVEDLTINEDNKSNEKSKNLLQIANEILHAANDVAKAVRELLDADKDIFGAGTKQKSSAATAEHLCSEERATTTDAESNLSGASANSGFVCTICKKCFKHASSLSRHLRCHSPGIGYTYACDVCGKVYNQRPNLKRHKFQVHQL